MGYTMKHKKGHFPFKTCPSGPMKQKPQLSLGGTNISLESDEEGKTRFSTSLRPSLKKGAFSIGGLLDYRVKDKYEKEVPHPTHSDAGTITEKGRDVDMFAGGTAGLSLSKGIPGSWNRFTGSLKGDVGYKFGTSGGTRSKSKLGYSGRLDLSVGRPGREACVGGMCYSPPATGWNVGLYGEHGSKHSMKPGTSVGVSGRVGWLKGDVGYNIQKKKPSYRLGLSIPF